MINILLYILCLVTASANHNVHAIQNTLKEDLELERKLKLTKKPAVKSIHVLYTNFGDIIDCVDIMKQPAFDHPLLKDHKLQRKPSIKKSLRKTREKNLPIKSIFGIEKLQCPKGTIPIKRITKDDLIQAKSLLKDGIMTEANPGLQRAEVSLSSSYGPYHGVSGATSIYNPRIGNKDQISASHLWIQNGPDDATNRIVAGWHVAPRIYGDDATHFYAAWTADNFHKTGCYNLRCSGFVQTEPGVYLGFRANKTSTYGGDIFELRLSINQDAKTKNWWLYMEDVNIGYFPGKLFPNMVSADQVGWGGRTKTLPGALSPPMGSGYLPDGDFSHSCYFRHVYVRNASSDYPFKPNQADIFVDNSKCFDLGYNGSESDQDGFSILFGGPGGNCGN